MILAACGGSDNAQDSGYVHVVEGEAETNATLTAMALANAAPTPSAPPAPTETPLPFTIPALPPGVDPNMVIARVGTEEITLDEFQKQVRFERWLKLWQLALVVEQRGAGAILDLRQPENAPVASLFATLADSNGFGEQVFRIMIIDAIAPQEAIRRGIEVDSSQFNSLLAQFMLEQVGENGQLPPDFDAQYAQFIQEMARFSGLTEEAFRRIVRARTLYAQLQYVIMQEPDAIAGAESASGALTPDELDRLRERYFLDWVESKMDDPAYTQDFDNWRAYIPQEPLPQDVSPLLRDDNVILPDQ
jgi:hypothetical protein